MTTPQTIGVIGARTMGNGSAQVCALAGMPTVMIDLDAALGRKSGRGYYTCT